MVVALELKTRLELPYGFISNLQIDASFIVDFTTTSRMLQIQIEPSAKTLFLKYTINCIWEIPFAS